MMFEYGMGMNFVWFILGTIFISLLGIGSNLLLAFCVYYDAMYRRSENAVLWAVLSGFFNIAALVYIIVQVTKKPQPMRCMQCGEFLVPQSQFCQRCGRPLYVPSQEQLAVYDKRRRLFLWLFIASMALIVIGTILLVGIFVGNIFLMNY